MGDEWTYTRYSDVEFLGDCLNALSSSCTVEVAAIGETVTVPAGTFTDCVQIVTTLDGTGDTMTVWWSPTAQDVVKQIDDGISYGGVETRELSFYNLK